MTRPTPTTRYHDDELEPYDYQADPGGAFNPTSRVPMYSVHCSTPQGAGHLSEPIVGCGPNPRFTGDDGRTSTEWMYHAYQALDNGPIKQQPEYAVEAQGYSSINNTRTHPYHHHLGGHQVTYGSPQYPPPTYMESIASLNGPYYETVVEPYCDQMDLPTAQGSYDCACLTPNSLHHMQQAYLIDDQPHEHVQFNLSSTSGTSQAHVDMDVTASSLVDPPPPPPHPVYGENGCLVVHSQLPPLSSYSELSAHTNYYSSLTESRPLAGTTTATGQQQSQPQQAFIGSNSAAKNASWDHSRSHTKRPSSSVHDLRMNTPPPPPSTTAPPPPFTWTPPPPPLPPVKSESSPDMSLLSSSSRKCTTESPIRTTSSSSRSESRRSRTLSPSSRSQGVLKTIMMKRGGSEPKKQNLACLFCRERKIACGRPAEGSHDPTCNQCARRSLRCEYPTESRRGQHKRSKKNQKQDQGHTVARAK